MKKVFLLGLLMTTGIVRAEFHFTDARQRGAFNTGDAAVTVAPDGRLIDYRISGAAIAGVWSKDYPDPLVLGGADRIEIAATVPGKGLAPGVALRMELKGSAGVQTLEVPLRGPIREAIDWKTIGKLSEVVLIMQRAGGPDPVIGRLDLDVAFQVLSPFQRFISSMPGKLVGVVVVAVLAMLLGFVRFKPSGVMARDVLLGLATTLLLATVWGVFRLAGLPLYFAAAGAIIGVLVKLAITGEVPAPGEAFRNALFTGLLALAASKAAVWQAPSSLASFGQLSAFGAALFVLLYHAANIYCLSATRKPIGLIGGSVIAATPFAFGLLCAIQTAGSVWRQGLFVLAFSEFLAHAASLVTRQKPIRDSRVHLALLCFSGLVVLAPLVADTGSRAMPGWLAPFAAVAATMLSQAPLWGLVYLLTGLVLDAMRGIPPKGATLQTTAVRGAVKGAVFGGVVMGVLRLAAWLVGTGLLGTPASTVLLGAIAFPIAKTMIETFDGSQSFFGRAANACRDPVLYARGLVAGLAFAVGATLDFPSLATGARIGYGTLFGCAAFGGVSLVRDVFYGFKSWRYYLIEGGLGAFVGAGLGFYVDASQLPILQTKFTLYTSFGLDPASIVARCQALRTTAPNEFTALISRWGQIHLSPAAGGAKILFNEALMGVIGWGIAAPLFAINRAFLAALIDRDASGIRRLPTREGVISLVDGTVFVLRWGLWMAPIIFTFLRPMAEATWYNQDGLVRTVFATVNSLRMDAVGFTDWSLAVFSWIIGFSWFQVLIWLDHMGLRVATLVNLSFLGMDQLDERCARFVGKDATARFIPEGIKRFTTWAPLLIPFYLPKGAQWEQVFRTGQGLQLAGGTGEPGWAAWGAVFGVATLTSAVLRRKRLNGPRAAAKPLRLANNDYAVELKASGELNSVCTSLGCGVTRPAFEQAEPSGRILFVLDADARTAWPVLGNFPGELFPPSSFSRDGDTITVVNESHGARTTVRITLPDRDDAVELWEVRVEDRSAKPRNLKLVPYCEWMLQNAATDRDHSQYNRLYPEMSYHTGLNALLALHRYTRVWGILASNVAPEGILSSRVDFIGRAGSVWTPRVFQTLAFLPALNMEAYPTFDPIGALLIDARAPVRIMIGCCGTQATAARWIDRYLNPAVDVSLSGRKQPARHPFIGHGEVPPGTPADYTEYGDSGTILRVLTPFTPRPFDHTMTNAAGHILAVTNRGLHSSANGNAQQNRLTTDWPDLAGSQMPSEAIYLYDVEQGAWFSPTYEPLRDGGARHEVRFGLDGSAVFSMVKDGLETELTVHVPVRDPLGIYQLTIRNRGARARTLRVAPYFQIVLAHSPELAGRLKVDRDAATGALYFENPRNAFRSGPCFVAMNEAVESHATRRGEFFGRGRTFAHPAMVEGGLPVMGTCDDSAVAAMMATVAIPAGGERVITIILGQGDTRRQAEACVARYQAAGAGAQSLKETRAWWLALQATLELETSDCRFDIYVKWMKYQALAERLWARKGFYQSSGAFGFRDQLQDAVNLIWVDPALARAQLLLHAAQQFPEGDTAHWFFCQQDGRTGLVCRSHTSDDPLWLGWGVAEYIRMTGDRSLLDERVNYLKAETPLPRLPAGKHGMAFYALRSPEAGSVYEHVLRAVDLVLDRRIGRNGLPLIGSGDWNDGFDEIGTRGRGVSVWLGLFLVYILKRFLPIIRERGGESRRAHYEDRLAALEAAIEKTWRNDRYLRAIHDDGTEIGIEGAGYWETDALGAAWAVLAEINPGRGRVAVDTALRVLEQETVVSLGFPPLREDTKPYLGRSSRYPEGVRENGMYCHGVQWLIRACRLLAEHSAAAGDAATAQHYRDACARLWYKISALSHVSREAIEIYGGQPNKQCADYLTKHDPGRMIWNGYTGAAAWMLRQALEGVIGATLVDNTVVAPDDVTVARGDLTVRRVNRDVGRSPLGK